MRRVLAWLLAIPLMVAGSQVAHVVAYRLVYPDAHVRLQALVASGHSYFDYAPAALGLAAAAILVSLAFAVADSSRGRAPRSLPPWAFAVVPPLAFVLQEHLERWLHGGVFPWYTVLDPTFLLGLLLQLPFALLAYLAARLLLRAAERVGCALAPRRERRRFAVSLSSLLLPAAPVLPRLSVLARCDAQRGPPLHALA